jgi:3-hydroxybutyryl-CoA dehydrogenase
MDSQIRVGIIGAGAMGSGIAQVAASAGCSVMLYDSSAQALQKAMQQLEGTIRRLEEKGRLSPGVFERIQPVSALSSMERASLVIEAIVEQLDVKQTLFVALEAIVPADCILATNTSSLSVTALAGACKHPERVIGLHFFNPAPLMKLVEIAPALQTAQALVERAEALLKQWGKTTVRVKDTPGFIVNRVARPFYGEALRIYEEGMANPATIDWAMTSLAGFRMGPFALMDLIGHDVNYIVTETIFKSFFFDQRYRPSFSQQRLVEARYLGRKTGRGFYDYREGAPVLEPDQQEVLGRQIADRIVVMLINEAADALFWQVASAEEIDLAMTQGVNYPKGLLRWADEWGAARCVAMLDDLYAFYGEDRYRCSPLIRRKAEKKEAFYPI